MDKIAKLQKRAIRIVNREKNSAHTAPLFKNARILPFDHLITYYKALFMHSVYYGYCPNSFSNNFQKRINLEFDHEMRNYNNFLVPHPRTEWFKKMPPYSFATLWNGLEERKLYANRATFSIALKNDLLSKLDV